MKTARLPPITEADFLAQVLGCAVLMGWLPYHTHDSRKSPAGFPDLVLVRERVVWAECKTEAGKLTLDQIRWLELLRGAGQEVYEWRPSDWKEIMRVLGMVA